MAFGTQDDADDVMNEINMTPLVDVMLVLLIIFIITVPVMKHSVNVDLPQASNQPEDIKPETVRLSVDASGQYHWNEALLSDDELTPRLLALDRDDEGVLSRQGEGGGRGDRSAQDQSQDRPDDDVRPAVGDPSAHHRHGGRPGCHVSCHAGAPDRC